MSTQERQPTIDEQLDRLQRLIWFRKIRQEARDMGLGHVIEEADRNAGLTVRERSQLDSNLTVIK